MKSKLKISVKRISSISFLFFVCIGPLLSCKKLVEIEPPTNSIVTQQAFIDDLNAISTVSGIYRSLSLPQRSNLRFGNGGVSILCGMSADELKNFSANPVYDQFANNTILYDNGLVSLFFWDSPYFNIYQANACIEGLTVSTTLTEPVRRRLLGEVKFIRAFCYFYLVNLFGDVPYLVTTDWEENRAKAKTHSAELYEAIVEDLKEAQNLLLSDYSASGNERIIVNKWAATALLARVQLYLKDWAEAEKNASLLLDSNGLFSLNTELANVFLKNSQEAILQWQLNSTQQPYNATVEGYALVARPGRPPNYFLTDDLMSNFEVGDKRKSSWVKTITYQNVVYNHPYKYKIGQGEAVINSTLTEYYMVLRLSEQYLIRAEARAHLNKLTGANSAASDLNAIRNRAGLGNTTATTQTEMLDAVAQERRIELFAEWGHRWLDLKRTGKVNEVLAPIKPMWKPHQQYYPIPFSELQLNPNLKPTPGY